MKKNYRSRPNWPAILCRLVYPCMVIAASVTLLFCSCTTTREVHHHHYQQANTLVTEAQADTHVGTLTAMLDSMLHAAFASQSTTWLSREDNTEAITETITTAIDSLGRELRTEQRTTTRSLSREEQQQWEQYQQEWELHMQRQMQQYDLLLHAFESLMEAHKEEVSTNDEQTIKNEQPLSWWERLKAKVGGIALSVLLIAVILVFTRQWWRVLWQRFRNLL